MEENENVHIPLDTANSSSQFIRLIERFFAEVTRLLDTDLLSTTNYQCVVSRLDVLSRSLTQTEDFPNERREALIEQVEHLRILANHMHQSKVTGGVMLQQLHGQRGRPWYNITTEMLTTLTESRFNAVQMASSLNVSVKTVRRRLRRVGLRRCDRQSTISQEDLDNKIKAISTQNKNTGERMMRARLEAEGTLVSRQKVRDSVHRVDPHGVSLRALNNNVHRRRQYSVAGPNSLWHFDGNHKLIRYNIVIHGCIDGYSRSIIYLAARNNNRAQTVLDCFLEASTEWGIPSRVRCDRGGENVLVCALMEAWRGPNRGSAIQGRSVHNQRIERLWVDVWKGVTETFYQIFSFLQYEVQVFQADNNAHIWCLHYIFLPRINRALADFQKQWNTHGIRTSKGCLAPKTMFMQGMLNLLGSGRTAEKDLYYPDVVDDLYGAEGDEGDREHNEEGEEGDREHNEEGEEGDREHNEEGEAAAEEDDAGQTPHVIVPDINCPFNEQIHAQVLQDIDPLAANDQDLHGLHLFENILSYL